MTIILDVLNTTYVREDIENLLNIHLSEWASNGYMGDLAGRQIECVSRLVDRDEFPDLLKSLHLRFDNEDHTKLVFFVRRRYKAYLYRDLEEKAIDCISDNFGYPTTGGDVRTLGLPKLYENLVIYKVNSCWQLRRNIPFVSNQWSHNWEHLEIFNSSRIIML